MTDRGERWSALRPVMTPTMARIIAGNAGRRPRQQEPGGPVLVLAEMPTFLRPIKRGRCRSPLTNIKGPAQSRHLTIEATLAAVRSVWRWDSPGWPKVARSRVKISRCRCPPLGSWLQAQVARSNRSMPPRNGISLTVNNPALVDCYRQRYQSHTLPGPGARTVARQLHLVTPALDWPGCDRWQPVP